MEPLAKYKVLRFMDDYDRVFFYNKTKGYLVPALIELPNRKDYQLTHDEKEIILKQQYEQGLNPNKFSFNYTDF